MHRLLAVLIRYRRLSLQPSLLLHVYRIMKETFIEYAGCEGIVYR